MNADLIESDPAILMGKPVVSGTRIAVELILEKLSAGESEESLTVCGLMLIPFSTSVIGS